MFICSLLLVGAELKANPGELLKTGCEEVAAAAELKEKTDDDDGAPVDDPKKIGEPLDAAAETEDAP